MTAKPESKLWKKLKQNAAHTGVIWTRLESWALPGVPDLHGIVDGHAFWVELKVHRLKSFKFVQLRPHQIAWQTQYVSQKGNVWNLVEQPSAGSLNLFHGKRALIIGESSVDNEPLTPDYMTTAPYDWSGIINHVISFPLGH